MLRAFSFLRFAPTQRFFSGTPQIINAFLKEAPQEQNAVEAVVPHNENHLRRILETLKQKNPDDEFMAVDLDKGTVLEGRDAAYSIEGTMPFSPLKTPLDKLPEGVKKSIIAAEENLGALPQRIELRNPIQAVANRERTVFYIDPTQFVIRELSKQEANAKIEQFPGLPF